MWFYQFSFATTAASAVSGTLAGRCHLIAYAAYTITITGLVYPVVVHWTWSDNPWLELKGFFDFGGSAIVHSVGGMSCLVAAIIVGPREMRKTETKGLRPVVPNSPPMVALGGFILAFGFLAFNASSGFSIEDIPGHKSERGSIVAMGVINTLLSGVASAVSGCIVHRFAAPHKFSLMASINCFIAGMVGACASCSSVEPWAAIVIGVICGPVVFVWGHGLVHFGIDDATDSTPIHLGCGIWGTLAEPIFRSHDGILRNWSESSFERLGWQFVGLICILVWTGGVVAILFLTLRYFKVMRVSLHEELEGLDTAEHGERSVVLDHDFFDGEWADVHPATKLLPVTGESGNSHANGHRNTDTANGFILPPQNATQVSAV